jgi:hypothetical protein
MIEREELAFNHDIVAKHGTLTAGRQWGPGVASYKFFPDSEIATVAASAW